MRIVLLVSVLVARSPLSNAADTTAINGTRSESSMTYHIHHPLHEVEATSKDLQCRITYNAATGEILHAFFSADVTSFDSGNSNRDSHAMEVLDALSYPTVSFNSKSITTTGTNLTVEGDLNFHGRTKPIVFAATTAKAADKLTVDGQANVSLTAFEIDRPSLLMIPVDDTLKISFIVVFPLAAK